MPVEDELSAKEIKKEKMWVWIHLAVFVIGNALLVAFWWTVSLGGIPVFLIITIAWGIVLVEHIRRVYKRKD